MTIPIPPDNSSQAYIPDVSALDGTVIPPVAGGLAAPQHIEVRATASARRTGNNPSKRFDTSVLGGTGLSTLNARTEGNVRDALNAQLLGGGAWLDASLSICGAMFGNPFIAGAIGRGMPDGEEAQGFNLFALLDGIQDFINWVINTLTCGVFDSDGDGTPDLIQTILQDFIDFIFQNPFVAPFVAGLQQFAEWLGRETGNFVKDVFIGLTALADWIKGVICCDPNVVGTTPLAIIEAVQDFIDAVLANPLVAAFTSWATSVGESVGNLFYDVLAGAGSLWTLFCSLITTGAPPPGFEWTLTDNPISEIIGGIVGIFEALCEFPLFSGLSGLVDGTGNIVLDSINGALAFVGQVLELFGLDQILNPTNIINWITGVINWLWNGLSFLTGGLTDQIGKTIQDVVNIFTLWISRIPLIGPLLLRITGIDPATLTGDPLTAALDAIGDFFDPASDLINNFFMLSKENIEQAITGGRVSLETFFAGITSGSLLGQIQQFFTLENLIAIIKTGIGLLLPTIPIGAVGDKEVNLLSLGEFKTIGTLEGSSGWSWDSTKNKTGVTGGSAKVTCTVGAGTTRQLYSNQNIPVVPGDKIGVSAFVNTSGYNGSSSSIQIGIVTFAGSVQKATYLLASRGASNNAWGEVTNRSSLWVVPTASTQSEQITSVQVTLAVAGSATQGTVNWDDLSLWKGGVLQQNLVEYLIAQTNSMIGGLIVPTGGTAQATNYTEPWNQVLAAAAAAKGTANTGVTNAKTADDKAIATNQAVFGVDVPSSTTKIQESRLPGSVGAVGSGIFLRRTTPGAYGNLGTGTGGPFPFSWYNTPGTSTEDITIVTSQGGITGVRLENAGWYVVEVSYGLAASNTGSRKGGGALYNYCWNFQPLVFYAVSSNLNAAAVKRGADAMMVCWLDGSTTFGNPFGWSQRCAHSTFIIYLEAGQWVAPGYAWNGPAGVDVLSADSQGTDTYFSVSLLNRSLA